MGNSALRDLAVIESISFDELSGSVVAIDAHNWLYRYLTTTVRWTASDAYTTAEGDEVPNLIGIMRGLPKFFEYGITPIFVFDGAVTSLKADEIADRREAKERAEEAMKAAEKAGDALEAARYEARTQRLTDTIHETTRQLFEILDIPCVEAPAEGEGQAAHMAKQGDVDYVGTEDYDALLFGAPVTLRQLTSSGDPERMDLAATLTTHDITQEQLVDIAILCGTDFNDGLRGYGPKTALKAIGDHGDLEGVLAAADAAMPLGSAVRELFLEPTVTDDYTIDMDIRPDIAGARTYLVDGWEIPEDDIATGLDRLEEAMTQTGLDRFS